MITRSSRRNNVGKQTPLNPENTMHHYALPAGPEHPKYYTANGLWHPVPWYWVTFKLSSTPNRNTTQQPKALNPSLKI